MTQEILTYTLKKLRELLAIDSPSGYTSEVADYLLGQFSDLGYGARKTNKGGVIADLGGEGDGIVLSAHVDTLGAMVSELKSNGALKVRPIGGLNANNVETEDATVITRDGQKYRGTFQLENASLHVNFNYNSTPRSFDTVELLLDELTSSKDETAAIGISVGDIVAVNPRTVITENGFIKSRFLDDKLSAAMLLGIAKYMRENDIKPSRHIYMNFTVYEEIGHGAAASIPDDVTEILGVDMGCVGAAVSCTERQVSICAIDGSGPYNYEMTTALVNAAKANGIDYALDSYPSYSSDCSVAVRSYDIRHALIGAGVYASHGYERSHVDGVKNTMELIEKYLLK